MVVHLGSHYKDTPFAVTKQDSQVAKSPLSNTPHGSLPYAPTTSHTPLGSFDKVATGRPWVRISRSRSVCCRGILYICRRNFQSIVDVGLCHSMFDLRLLTSIENTPTPVRFNRMNSRYP